MSGIIGRYRREAYALGIALIFVGGMFFLGRAYTGPPCSNSEGSMCWSEYYATLLADEGAEAALADLKQRVAEGGGAKTFCHPILHDIGAHAAREYGSLAEAFKHGDSVCRAGYYHGVLEGVFGESGDQLLESLDGICASVSGRERYSYEYFSCVHGIGHGLMAYFQHDVFESLSGCDRLSGEWEQESCYGGVFMENVMSDTSEIPSRFFQKEDPMYPCTAVRERYRVPCYLMQSSQVLKMSGGDFAAVFAACDGVDAAYRRICYESIGRDVSGVVGGSIESALTLCALGSGEAEEACVVGAAVDFVQSMGVERAYELCRASGDSERVCTNTVMVQEGML